MEVASIDKTKEWTIEDYLQLDEGLLAQLIDGKLIMSPAPTTRHQRILKNLFLLIERMAEGETFFSPIDLYLGDKDVFQPDLIYISESNKNIVSNRGIEGVPDLIAEVISPSNSFVDRNTKKKKYLKAGVVEYWIVDPANETLEIYTPDDEDNPRLYLAKDGEVNSIVSRKIHFDLKELFDIK